jgi:hypothetical protein
MIGSLWEALSANRENAPLKDYDHPRSSAKLKTPCSKWFVVSGGEHSIACLVASCPFGCGSSIEYTDQNRPHPPTRNARPITSGWSKPLQMPVKQSNQQNSMPGQIKAALPHPTGFSGTAVTLTGGFF